MIPRRQVTRLVAPFGYRQPWQESVNAVSSSYWRQEDPGNQRLLRHIDNLVKSASSAAEPIGKRWVLSAAGREHYGLPPSPELAIQISIGDEQYQCHLLAVELYLFETNVGFLVFDVDYPADYTLDDMIQANYHLKKFTLPALELTFEAQGKRQACRFSEAVRRVVEPFDWETFFEQDDLLIALVYYMALLPQPAASSREPDRFMEWVGSRLFRMRRSFTHSFKAAPEQDRLAVQDEVESVFQNSHWGISMEAMANLAYLTGDPNTDEFFEGAYIHNVKTTYFYLYLLGLHQRYALLMLSIMASRLPAQLTGLQDGGVISELQERMAIFTLRGSFRQVSNVTHQSRLYDKLRSMLRIEELMEELDTELEVLSSLAEVRARRREERQRIEEEKRKALLEKRQVRFHNYVMIMSTLFVVISTVADAFGLIDTLRSRGLPPLYSTSFYLLSAVSIVIGILVLLMFGVLISNWRFHRKHSR